MMDEGATVITPKVVVYSGIHPPDPEQYDLGDILLFSQNGWGPEHSVYICVLKGVQSAIGARYGHKRSVDIRKRWVALDTGDFHPRTMKTYCPCCKEMIGEYTYDMWTTKDYTEPVKKEHKCCGGE